MADYVEIKAAPLEMEFFGGKVDLLSLGVAQISLQRITEKVAYEMLTAEGVLAPGWKGSTHSSRLFQPEYPRIMQVEVSRASVGSYYSLLTFAVIATLSDPHVIAMLDNLGANVIWALSTSGLQVIRHRLSDRIPVPKRYRRQKHDPYGIEAIVRDIILIAEQNPNIKAIRCHSAQNEVTLDLKFYRRSKR